jgi:anti-anti-sigma regulatory factor
VKPIVVDVSALTDLDEEILDALVRLQLAARRNGLVLELRDACPRLVDALELCGLRAELGVEVNGVAEEAEQRRIDEEVDPPDAPV